MDAIESKPILNSDQISKSRHTNIFSQPSNQSPFTPNASTQSLDPNPYHYSTSHAFLDIPQHSSPSPNTATATPSLSSDLSYQPDSFPMSPINFTDPHFPLADISSVMFTSPDPFAYPEQNIAPAQSYHRIPKTFNQNFFGYSNAPNLPNLIAIGTDSGSPDQTTFLFNGAVDNKDRSTAYAAQIPDSSFSTIIPSPTTTSTAAVGGMAPSLQVPNMNLDQLLGGEEWAGLDRTMSGMGAGAYLGPVAAEGLPLQGGEEEGLGFEGTAGIERFGWGVEGGWFR